MASFSGPVWLVLGLVAGGGVLMMLYGMALVVRNQIHLHETRLRVARLRLWYAAQLEGRHCTPHPDAGTTDEQAPAKAA
jgi:hypothetical protein